MFRMEERIVTIHSADDLGAPLRMLRKESGLTQRDTSGLCNVSLPFLNQVAYCFLHRVVDSDVIEQNVLELDATPQSGKSSL